MWRYIGCKLKNGGVLIGTIKAYGEKTTAEWIMMNDLGWYYTNIIKIYEQPLSCICVIVWRANFKAAASDFTG